MPVSTVILAAGLSRRMGFPKALLNHHGASFIQSMTQKALDAGSAQVIVVTADANEGFPFKKSDALKELASIMQTQGSKIRLIKGQSSGHPIDSLRHAICECPQEYALCLWPIDYPFAEVSLLKALFTHPQRTHETIVVPTLEGKRGHPVLFGQALKAELLSPLADEGAHHVVRRKANRVVLLKTTNPNIRVDLNTPQDAAALGIKLH
ncbi:MAG: NTP transferase domain-containing protein [Myxococcota bacterium]|jgi:molybdenum cofactor cytidylyltransferase|nr:NTP transferase domain-containing protein [Myxococcota bacterium]